MYACDLILQRSLCIYKISFSCKAANFAYTKRYGSKGLLLARGKIDNLKVQWISN